jgi:hypothetical protein
MTNIVLVIRYINMVELPTNVQCLQPEGRRGYKPRP